MEFNGLCYCVLLTMTSLVTVVTSCPQNCSCVSRYAYSVDCARAQFPEVPPDIPQIAELLDLSGNQITKLSNESFPSSLSQLKELYLDTNSIQTINSGVFLNMPNLTSLQLDNNHLLEVADDSFQGLSNLQSLFISHNRLRRLSTAAFRGLDELNLFVVEGNNITLIENGTFQYLPKLSYLRLQNNKLTSLQEGLFNSLYKLREVYLSGNDISTIHPRAFYANQGLIKVNLINNSLNAIPALPFAGNLTTLILDNNLITSVSAQSVMYREKLVTLSINENQISSIEYEIFQLLPHLRKFLCRGNHLRWIDSHAGEYINETDTIDFTENPWICDYKLHWTTQWSFDVSIFGTCGFPEKYAGRTVASLSPEDFYVAPERTSLPTEYEFNNDEPLTITCPVFAFPKPDIEWFYMGNAIKSTCNDCAFQLMGVEGRIVNSSLYFHSPQNELEGIVRCLASNKAGRLEIQIKLIDSLPTIHAYKEAHIGTTPSITLNYSEEPKGSHTRSNLVYIIAILAILCVLSFAGNAYFYLDRKTRVRVAPIDLEPT